MGQPQAAYDAALAAARKAGAEAERTRIGAILNHEAAAGRGKLAAHVAFKTSMSVEDAGEMLAASAAGLALGGATGAAGAGAETLDWNEIVAGLNATIAPQPAAAIEGGTR
ncbi:hypothetical protein R1A27_06455 [Methylobacterium sp. NMS12]|uniref:hypothetical protein n=1 Tax=Methylobacterium sp. NMS12 TaxID=3079766 RepID=UPI003F883DD3